MPNELDKFKNLEVFDRKAYSDFRNAIDHETQATRSSFADAAMDGRAFISGTGQIEASDILRALIENPTTDKLVVLTKIEWYNGGDSDYFGQIIKNPTSGLPTSEQNYTNLYSKPDNSEQTSDTNFMFDSGTTNISGGDVTGIEITFSQGDNQQEFVYVLEPGSSIGVNIDTGGGLTSETVKFTVFYIEVPL